MTGDRSNSDGENAGTDTVVSPSKDEIFFILSNRRRRYVLHSLKRSSSDFITLGELATRVAAWEHDKNEEKLAGTERKRVYTALQQSHLPKMAEAGIIEYEPDRGVIKPTRHTEGIDVYLEVTPKDNWPWTKLYVGVSVVTLALAGALTLDLYPFDLVSGELWLLFVGATFLLFSLHQIRNTDRLGSDSYSEIE